MLRRKDGFRELWEQAATLPWKVTAAVAPVCFLACFAAAALTQTPPDGPAAWGPALMRQFVHDGATVFEFLLPAALLVVAAVSGLNRACSNALFQAAQSDPETTIPALSQRAFKNLIAKGFRHRGFVASDPGGNGPDRAVDLLLARDRTRFLVRCKQGRHAVVGESDVRELHEVMSAEKLDGGYLITSGSFTDEAKELAAPRNIELLNGKDLSKLIGEAEFRYRKTNTMPNVSISSAAARNR